MEVLRSWASDFQRADPGIPPPASRRVSDDLDEKKDVLGEATLSTTSLDRALQDESPLKRKLVGRHVQFIALGGSVGTGLFVGSGATLQTGGPALLMVGFLLIAFLVITVMFAIGELAAVLPVTGVFSVYSNRFIDPSWGFALGWMYWVGWAVLLPLECIATAIIIQFWDPQETVPRGVWVAISLFLIIVVNLFGVRGYGEVEFATSFIKVVGCIGFILAAIVITCGGSPSGHYMGAHTWHDPGPVANGFKGFCSVFITAAFAFAGTELVGLTAAETHNPRIELPRACKQVVFRVLLFYILSLFMITLIVPYNDERLVGGSNDPRVSPFVIALQIGGIKVLPSIFNAVILISALSVGNTAVYAGSRTLHALAEHGQGPQFLTYVDRTGRPLMAVLLTLAFGLLGFLIYTASESEIFVRRRAHPELALEHFQLGCDFRVDDHVCRPRPFPPRMARAGAYAARAALGVTARGVGLLRRRVFQLLGGHWLVLCGRFPDRRGGACTDRSRAHVLPWDAVAAAALCHLRHPQARH